MSEPIYIDLDREVTTPEESAAWEQLCLEINRGKHKDNVYTNVIREDEEE